MSIAARPCRPAPRACYFFADYCSGEIWGARQVGGGWVVKLIRDTHYAITTFGETEAGELCFSDHSTSGAVYCVVPCALRS